MQVLEIRTEQFSTCQRIGIEFAITELNIIACHEMGFASSRFGFVLPRKPSGKSPKESKEY